MCKTSIVLAFNAHAAHVQTLNTTERSAWSRKIGGQRSPGGPGPKKGPKTPPRGPPRTPRPGGAQGSDSHNFRVFRSQTWSDTPGRHPWASPGWPWPDQALPGQVWPAVARPGQKTVPWSLWSPFSVPDQNRNGHTGSEWTQRHSKGVQRVPKSEIFLQL